MNACALVHTDLVGKGLDAMANEVLVSVEEAARRLNVGRSMAYVLIRRGDLASIKIGASRRVPVAALDEYVLTQRELQDSR